MNFVIQREGAAILIATFIYAANEAIARWIISKKRQTRERTPHSLMSILTLYMHSDIIASGGDFAAAFHSQKESPPTVKFRHHPNPH